MEKYEIPYEKRKILAKIAVARAEAEEALAGIGRQIKKLDDPEKIAALRAGAAEIGAVAAVKIKLLREALKAGAPDREKLAEYAESVKYHAYDVYRGVKRRTANTCEDVAARASETFSSARERASGRLEELKERASGKLGGVGDIKIKLPSKEALASGAETVKGAANALYRSLRDEIASIRERDPAAASAAEVVLFYPGFHAVLSYRVAHKLYQSGLRLAAAAVSRAARDATGIEIHPAARIGKNLFIDHGSAVVIGETAIIGDNCTIYQGVTLGGTGKHVGKRHPTIGSNVMVGAGAKVLGPVVVGDNVKIAAGAVVLKDIPANCTAVGIPARVVRENGVRSEQTLDQCNVPDPVAQELALLRERVAALEEKSGAAAVSKDEEKPGQ